LAFGLAVQSGLELWRSATAAAAALRQVGLLLPAGVCLLRLAFGGGAERLDDPVPPPRAANPIALSLAFAACMWAAAAVCAWRAQSSEFFDAGRTAQGAVLLASLAWSQGPEKVRRHSRKDAA
jgi:hypothetical protein